MIMNALVQSGDFAAEIDCKTKICRLFFQNNIPYNCAIYVPISLFF